MEIKRIQSQKEQEQLLRVGKTNTEEELLRFGVQKGMDFSEESVVKWQKDAERSRVRATAAAIMGQRALSKAELLERLRKKDISEEQANEAITWLEGLGAVNDAFYAELLVRKYARNGYGLARIREELRRHKVPKELWEEALETVPQSDEKIKSILDSRLKGDCSDPKAVRRAVQALLRRGFSWQEIRPVLQEYGVQAEE